MSLLTRSPHPGDCGDGHCFCKRRTRDVDLNTVVKVCCRCRTERTVTMERTWNVLNATRGR